MGPVEGSIDAKAIDWHSAFDHADAAYAADPFTIWDDLRETCPVARSPRFRGMWVPTRHADIEAIARDTDTFSSRSPLIATFGSMAEFGMVVPPISSDPPYHTGFRQLLLPFFAPRRIEAFRPAVEAHADELIDAFIDAGHADAAEQFAQHIPVRVIATMLGVSDDGERFRRWVRDMVEAAPTDFPLAATSLMDYHAFLVEEVERRRTEPGDDLISFLLSAELDGRPLSDNEIFGGALLLLVAGIDTTWSAIGSTVWHLATNPDDQRRLRDSPELWTTAVEEFLRAYSPVTMGREVAVDTEVAGCPMKAGDPLLLPFPAANRDPEAFERADEVILDREHNRHLAFGLGIHRCLGSNLARLEITVAVERLLARLPTFALADPDAVTWSTGQVRGPRTLPIVF